ncbi:uncharacterized protein LOC123681832 [Harmonia axyridis]|uniref:uncharacterized protein LOC123681832 n=1 Tax=Harmonia axyridis TaxID=115357 RepID=UPI001E279800|nr:uncharacterized protein LOC123681832 [Harmonia axyridis]
MFTNIWIISLFLMIQEGSMENFTQGCGDPVCLKCGRSGCVKCPHMIMFPTRKCVDSCPFGHKPSWSTYTEYMGLICIPNGNFMGLSYDLLAIIAGILTGTIICLIFIAGTLLYFKYRRKKTSQSIESSSDIEDSLEKRREFFKQLEGFRPYAQIFLDMLNDTRKRIRDLSTDGDHGAIQAYRPVVRDLTKILILLNRNPEQITVPDDWENLLAWAEQTLQRYKRISGCSQGQVSQLVNFLQKPAIIEQESTEDLKGSTTMSTFKPDQPLTASTSLQDIVVHNFNSNYDSRCLPSFNPQWKFQYSLVSSNAPTTEFNPSLWKNSKEYLNSTWLVDDDFLQLGFRPQDEITTEL